MSETTLVGPSREHRADGGRTGPPAGPQESAGPGVERTSRPVWLRRIGVLVLVVAVVLAAVDVGFARVRLGHAVSALHAARRGLGQDAATLGRTGHGLNETAASVNKLDDAKGTATGELNGAQQQLSVASAGVDIQGYAASTLSTCLSGVDLAFAQLGKGDQAGAVATIDSVSGPCLSLESGGAAQPVYPFDLADPSIIVVGTTYYAYGTNAEAGNVQVLSSSDLTHWTAVGNGLPNLPGWAVRGDTWAPAVYARDGGFFLFYTARVAATGQQCISEAVASSPTGPFVDSSTAPLICQAAQGARSTRARSWTPTGRPTSSGSPRARAPGRPPSGPSSSTPSG